MTDARTGFTVADCTALGLSHGQWFGFSEDEPELMPGTDRWALYAPSYRPARGDFARAVPTEADENGIPVARIDVALVPGYAAAILFHDAASTRLVAPEFGNYLGDGLAGVQVFAGTELVAESDAHGLALVDLPREPESLHFGLPGWRAAGEVVEDGLRIVPMVRE